MDITAPSLASADPAAAGDRAQRQLASLQSSLGWMLGLLEPFAPTWAPEGAGPAARLRRASRQLCWTSPEQERLVVLAERMAALEAEAQQALASAEADALAELALRLEKNAAEALASFVAMQAEAGRAADLSRTTEAEEDQPPRLRARADIGAAVRARLAQHGAEKLPAAGLELYRVREFIDPERRQGLIALIERDLFPSGVLGDRHEPGFRTSQSCNLPPSEPLVDAFETKVETLLGYNRRFTEAVQGQRYEVGQQFKPHHDFFHKGESYYEDVATTGGQRTWTAMLFLNQPEAGGYTNFPAAAARLRPEAGTLLVWNNMQPDGRANHNSLHQGTPVDAGRKYVLTKWCRERPLFF